MDLSAALRQAECEEGRRKGSVACQRSRQVAPS